jgi:hypothetical protein
MTDANCWRCVRKLFAVAEGSTGAVEIICPRCGAKQRVLLEGVLGLPAVVTDEIPPGEARLVNREGA